MAQTGRPFPADRPSIPTVDRIPVVVVREEDIFPRAQLVHREGVLPAGDPEGCPATHPARYDTCAERRRFERERRPGVRDDVPERFPPTNRMASWRRRTAVCGSSAYGRATARRELHLLDPDGIRFVGSPCRRPALLDPGLEWAPPLERAEFDELKRGRLRVGGAGRCRPTLALESSCSGHRGDVTCLMPIGCASQRPLR